MTASEQAAYRLVAVDDLGTSQVAVVEDAPIVPVTWVCGYATAPEKMTVKGENKTNIPSGYLPIRCRS